MNYTENLKLKKPEQEEFYDVDDFNHNADILDSELQNIKDNYSLKNHNHDTAYSDIDHNHDDVYSKLEHNHDDTYLSLNGGTINNSLTIANGGVNFKNGCIGAFEDTEWKSLDLYASSMENGASFHLYDKDSNNGSGSFSIFANNGTNKYALTGYPNGSLLWDNKNIVRSVNGVQADTEGNVTISSSGKAYITETYHSGAQFYRKWSDGFIEQGGLSSSGGTVTLNTAFSSSDYVVVTRMTGGSNNVAWSEYGTNTVRTTTSFTVGNKSVFWYACGY